jgi:CrcB protein
MMTQVWLAVGGAAGTLLRYWLNLLMTAWFGERLPWGTIVINISGSFLIGLLAALTEPGGRWMASSDIRLFLMVGVCGGYTTFSSFSLQTLILLQTGEPLRAAANVVGSVTLGLLAVWIGYAAFSFLLHGSRS